MSDQAPSKAFEYTGTRPVNGSVGERLASRFLDLVCELPGTQSVCDLGCGNGHLAGQLVSRGRQVVGVDASASGIEVARQVHGTIAEFICAPIDAALAGRLGRDRFDAVVSSDVIEHLYHPRQLIACARAILKPGGYLVVGTPFHGYFKNLALSLLDRWDPHHESINEGGHIKFFSEATLGWLVQQEEFAGPRFHFFGRFPYLWKHMVCIARKSDSGSGA